MGVDPARKPTQSSALPAGWESLWGEPSVFLKGQIDEIRKLFSREAEGITTRDFRSEFGALVGPADNYRTPVHRWYPYKESFSHNLPLAVQRELGLDSSGTVIDVFAGVGTTALALRETGFDCVVGVEYSPFSQFVGETKLAWADLSLESVRSAINEFLEFEVSDEFSPPILSSFRNEEIFDPDTLHSLLSAREHLGTLPVGEKERSFLLLGLAAIVEDVSGAMKDGRALRILHERKRVSKLLTAREPPSVTGDPVRDVLGVQLSGMKEDVADLSGCRKVARAATAHHLRGDARDLAQIELSAGKRALTHGSASFSIFSPPYLNCIDYSEIYKLELWLLEMINSPEEFRELRLGTLRSHPSIDFPERGFLNELDSPVVELIDRLSDFIERNHAQPAIGRMVGHYFDDMYRVLVQQAWVLEPGSWMVCVVGNSTFSGRRIENEERKEVWRIPLLTDLIIARLAEAVGLEDVQIWTARDLRARNARGAKARESAVVARKPA